MLNLLKKYRGGDDQYKEKENKVISHQILNTPINLQPKGSQGYILFGCGCFWGSEKGFWRLPGVITTAVGYAGGDLENPTYKEICSGETGHAEVVRVVWNKEIVDLSDLLKLFWECHDPTQGNRQGNDCGSQYRSTIYTYSEDDHSLALASKRSYEKRLMKNGFSKITTEIKQNINFNFAEEYHQQYLARKGSRPYCSAMPTKVLLEEFDGSNFKLDRDIWSNYNWEISHCVLRSDNQAIEINNK